MKLITQLTVVMLSISATDALACTKDTDCKGDRICVESACAAPATSASPQLSEPKTSTESTQTSGGTRSFHMNILGLLQFGLTPTVEFGGQTTFLLRARPMNTGLLSYIVAGADGADLVFGMGLSAQARKYLGPNNQLGPYFGGGLELMYTETDDGDKVYETTFVVPQFEGGVRWDHGTYFSAVGVFLGAAIPMSTVNYDIDDADTYITGGFHWDIGWYF